MARIALIGGSGFIGSVLCRQLREAGIEALVGDLVAPASPSQPWRACDVRNGDGLAEVLRGCSAAINLAAEHRDDVQPIGRYYDTNVEGARRLCAAMAEAGVQHLVFTSSVSVYGAARPGADEGSPLAPANHYGASKAGAEAVYREWQRAAPGRRLAIVRPTAVFGPGNRGNFNTLVEQVADGRFLMVGSGHNRKSLAYVENIAAALRFMLQQQEPATLFNYVDGPDLDMNQLIGIICAELRRAAPRRIPYAVGIAGGAAFDLLGRLRRRPFAISAERVRKFCAATTFASERIRGAGFAPPFSLESALRATVREAAAAATAASKAPQEPAESA